MHSSSGRPLGVVAFWMSLVSAAAYFAASEGVRNFVALLGQAASRAGGG